MLVQTKPSMKATRSFWMRAVQTIPVVIRLTLFVRNKMIEWTTLRVLSEESWSKYQPQAKVSGMQFQNGTQWNEGLEPDEIIRLEKTLKLKLPNEFKAMLVHMNGIDLSMVDIYDPDSTEFDDKYFYSFPEDIYSEGFEYEIKNLNKHFELIDGMLRRVFSFKRIEGFIPIFGHRSIVVLDDKELCPVISAIGNDIILYGKDLISYWFKELDLNY